MLVAVGYEQNIHSHLDCCKPLDGFLPQSERHDDGYHLWVIPESIWVSREVTNLVGVCYSWIAMDTWIFSTRRISKFWDIFAIDEGVACWLIVKKTQTSINYGFYCNSKDGIYHMHYAGVLFVSLEHFVDFICDGFYKKYFLWWGLEKDESTRWMIIPFFGGNSHH